MTEIPYDLNSPVNHKEAYIFTRVCFKMSMFLKYIFQITFVDFFFVV